MTAQITAEEFDRMFDAGEDVIQYTEEVGPSEALEIVTVRLSPERMRLVDERARERGKTRGQYLSDLYDAVLATA